MIKKTAFIQTLGCQMNAHDSMRMEEVLAGAGYVSVDAPSEASVFVVNTCSVREKAEQKLLSLLGRVRVLKESRPDMAVVVAGCVAQQEGERLLKRAPVVDIVLGPDNIGSLPHLLRDIELGGLPKASTVFDLDAPTFLQAHPERRGPEVSTYVTVMKGCDERCTFCIVPHTRGPERYRAREEIIDEIVEVTRQGAREVTLLGQTVNSWFPSGKQSRRQDSDFAELLQDIAKAAPSLFRLRYTSPHPRHITQALIEAHATLDVLPRHVHMPVQSGSNAVLKRMLRRYTREEYITRVRALQEACPGLTLSTDIIVGFPGETEEDFADTVSLVQEVGFVSAFAFKYSPRPFTPALQLGDDVSEDEKDRRLRMLLDVTEKQQHERLMSLVGTEQRLLIEAPSRSPSSPASAGEVDWSGRSERNEIVHVALPEAQRHTGAIVRVRIDEAFKHSMRGSLLAVERPALEGAKVPLPANARPRLNDVSMYPDAPQGGRGPNAAMPGGQPAAVQEGPSADVQINAARKKVRALPIVSGPTALEERPTR